MSIKVNIKWNKEKFEKIELDTCLPVEVFQAQIYALTGVPIERQKVLVKGKTLKDTWDGIIVKNGMTLMLMGSADELFKKPTEKVVFLEDLTESQKNQALNIPVGLFNLGNTCYMNASIQCLKSCPDLVSAVKKFNRANMLTSNITDAEGFELTSAFNNLIIETEKNDNKSFTPMGFLTVLLKHRPYLGELDSNGQPMQQDANEFWALLMRCFQSMLKAEVNLESENALNSASKSQSSNFINQYFAIDFENELKCVENENEEIVKSVDTELQLSCYLDKEVKYLMSGIKNRLSSQVEKFSTTLNRNSIYQKTTKITKLPTYLSVQMVRFFYKESKTTGQPGVNAKILKDVKFPLSLDLYDACSDQLKEKLAIGRKRFEDADDWKREQLLKIKEDSSESKSSTETDTSKNSQSSGAKNTQDPVEKQSFLESNPKFISNPGENCSGHYELYGVLTHKGRSSSSGHYVSWCRNDPLKDNWYLFDDENVSEVTVENILQLSGGGDWHTSYVLLYGPKRIRIENAENAVEVVVESTNITQETSVENGNESMQDSNKPEISATEQDLNEK